MAVKIFGVTANSHADRAKIKSGESLLTINGNIIEDVLDYRFHQVNRDLTLEIQDGNGDVRTVKIYKSEYEEIGLEFETYLMDEQKSCRNKCIFCFIDQLPKGMRESLYFKDDDSRLSFLFGNYITLTNLSQHEIDRIIKMHISPINVSVHTTNPQLRCKAGISLNCQIVACPGINDGEELLRTFKDLEKLDVNMTAVVPVGLTRYREGLYPLTEYTQETAEQTVDLIEKFGDECVKKYGRRIFYAGDEFYIKAGRPIPEPDFYEGFPAVEDGIGMIACLKEEIEFAVEDSEYNESLNYMVTMACGEAVAPYLRDMMKIIATKFPNVKINVVAIKNNFFGGGVNVSGLVTGGDLIAQLKGKELGEKLFIPSSMLRFENDVFLDDVSVEDVERELNISLGIVNNNGDELVRAVTTVKEMLE